MISIQDIHPHQHLFDMWRIRLTEETISKRYSEYKMRCPVHLSIGQEASAVGVCSALSTQDWAFSGHRNHAHYLAKGGSLKKMIAELYGKREGCCAGRGGSMHLMDQSAGFLASTPIVGSTVPIAVGAALTQQIKGENRIVVVFLGDGAMECGVVLEAMNFAAVRKLNILFVCENNFYSVYSPMNIRQPSGRQLRQVAEGQGLNSFFNDGNDVHSVNETTQKIINNMKSSPEPFFLELETYRWREHCGPNYDNDIGYRTEEEFEAWRNKCPIANYEKTNFTLNHNQLQMIQSEIDEAFDHAENCESCIDPIKSDLQSFLSSNIESPSKGSRVVKYSEAILEAHKSFLDKYNDSILMGLGVPDPKGIFGTTLGLQDQFGSDRVFDIPLSEAAMTGITLGCSITGLKPVLTHQRLDFSLVSIDQIVNQIAKWSFMFNDLYDVPLVIRFIIGRGWGQGPQHSQSLHSWFGHIPGLKVVMPSNAYDAKGLLLAAMHSKRPVLYLEHRWCHSLLDYVPEEDYCIPLDKAKTVISGTDITIVAVSFMVVESIKAAGFLSSLGISVEVIDLISIRPIDRDSIVASVSKTGRLLVIDHAELSCGVSAEIIALVSETIDMHQLKSKPSRLGLKPYPLPTSHFMSEDYYPSPETISREVLNVFGIDVDSISFESLRRLNGYHDQPDSNFLGPF